MMNLIGILLLVAGVIGFAINYMGVVDILSLEVWGGMAVVGAVLTVLLRRPAD